MAWRYVTRAGIGDSVSHAEADGAVVCVVAGNWPDRIGAVTETAYCMQSDSALKQATTANGALNPPPSHYRHSENGRSSA